MKVIVVGVCCRMRITEWGQWLLGLDLIRFLLLSSHAFSLPVASFFFYCWIPFIVVIAFLCFVFFPPHFFL